MNLVLFEASQLDTGLAADDARVVHVRTVLRRGDGDPFDAGLVNGPRGTARFTTVGADRVGVAFEPTAPPQRRYPIDVIVGLSRPQTCRHVLRALTTLGVRRMDFVPTDRGEASYAQSKLWTTGEADTLVRAAVAQAFDTVLPEFRVGRSLAEAAAEAAGPRIALDNYEASISLPAQCRSLPSLADAQVAIGPERGWSDRERQQLRDAGYTLTSLGPRVLRVETAAVAAISAVLAEGFWGGQGGTASSR